MKKIEPGTEMNTTNLASVELIGEKNITNNESLYVYFRPEPVLLVLKQGYSLKSIKTQHMKKSLLFLFALIIGILSVKAQPGLMDDFTSLTNGDVNGQSGWARTSGTGVQLTVDDASPFSGNLGYASAGGTGTAGGRYLLSPAYSGSGTNRYGKSFGAGFAMGTGGNACYYSVLINVSAATNADSYSFSINTGTNYVGRLFIRTEGAGYKLGISKNSNTAVYNGSPTTLSFNTTYLVVVRYFTVTGSSNDQVHVWINPDLTAEPSTSSGFEVAITSGTDPSTGTYSNIHWQCVSNAPTFKFDGLRVVSASGSATAWQNLMANANYYLASSGNANSVASWGSATNGTGVTPPVFTDNYHNFNLRNNATPTIGAAWTVSGTSSKAIVGDGTNACNFTIPSGFAYTGTIDVNNAGTLTIQNTTIPTLGTLATGSTVNYNGSSGQTVTGTTYSNLAISNASNVTSGGAATVNGTLTLNAGKISLGANNLTLGSSASISGASSSNYIVTNSSGSVLRSIASGGGTFTFPIGRSASAYNPLTITNQGGSTSVYTVSTAATTNTTSDQINAQWSIASSASTTTDLGLGWATADAIGTLTSSPSTGQAYQYNGATWDARGGSTSGTPNVTTVTGITSLTNPLWTVGAAAVTPDVAISASSPAAGNITRNTTDRILYGIQLVVTTGNASFTGLTVNTSIGDTYAASSAADVKNFKLWINTSNSLSGATQLGSTVTNAPAHGGSIAFSGPNLPAALNTVTGTYYLLVTCDVDAAAAPGAFITIGSTAFTNISFASANKSGTDPVAAGNAQTIVDAPTVTTDAASAVATTSVTLNGTVSANALSTTVSFDYGLTNSYGSTIAANETPVTTQSAAVTANLGSLTANTLYHFRATGTNAVNTTNGADAEFTTLSLAPTANAGTNVGPTFFDANWSDPTGQGSETFTITLQVDDNNSFTTPDEYTLIASGVETYSVTTGLATGTQYYYRVRAVNAGGNSAWSGTETITTTSSTAPVLTTGTVTAASIVVDGAEVAGNDVISDGGSTITARGLVYNTSSPAETGGTLVPLGSGTTGLFDQTLSGLSANTLYYVKAYATNGIGTTYGSPEESFVTLAAEPTVASSASITNRTTTSLEVSFSGGNGGRRIVLVKQGSAVDGTPADRITYTADANFGDGEEIGTGNFVAYDGTGGSVTITGLTLNTTYHVAVFEYNNNSVNSPNYYTTAGTANATTYNPTVVVTGSLTAFGNTVAGSTSASQSYTVEGTELMSSITITAPSGFEISEDDVDFSVNPIVLTRDGNDEVATTTIYARFAPSAATGATGTLNITHTATDATTQNVAVSGNAIAAQPAIQASAVNFTAVTSTGFTVNFTAGDGSNRLVVIRAGADPSVNGGVPADGVGYTANTVFGTGSEIGTGNFVVYSGTGSSVVVTGLSGSTTYHVAVYEFNEGTGTSQNYNVSSPALGSQLTDTESFATDYFRSIASGDWDDATPSDVWESSIDGSTNWHAATLTPTSAATLVTIQNTHTVTIAGTKTLGATTVASGGTLTTAGAYTVAASTTLTVAAGGTLNYTANSAPTITGSLVVNGIYQINSATPGTQVVPTTNTTYGATSDLQYLSIPITGDAVRLPVSIAGTVTWNASPASGTKYNYLNATGLSVGNLVIQNTGARAIGHGTGGTGRTLTVTGNMTVSGGDYAASLATGTTVSTLTVNGNLAISGGTLSAMNTDAGGSSTGANAVNLRGDVAITGGVLSGKIGAGTGTGTLTLNGTTAQAITASGTYTVGTMAVNNAAGVNVNSDLTVGTLTVSGGLLTVTGSNTLTSSNSITVSSGATIGGTGTVAAAISASGTVTANLSGSGSIGTLAVTGNTTFNATGIYQVDINNVTGSAGTINDLLAITGNLSVTAGATVNLSGTIAGFDNTQTYTWTIATVSGTSTTLSNFAITTSSLSAILGTPASSFSLSRVGNNIILTYSPASPTKLWTVATNAGAWLTAGNWSPSGVPGSADLAVFGTNPSTSPYNVGINMNGATNNGANNQTAAAIHVTSTRSNNLVIGNSSTSADGTLTLTGGIINGTPASILNEASSAATLTIQNTAGSGNRLMGLNLPSSAVIVAGAGSTTAIGNTINVTSVISGAASGITFRGNGSGTTNGGLLRLGATNTFANGIAVGLSDGTQYGILQLDALTSVNNTSGNNITINPNSQLYLAAAGTYTTGNLTLTLNGNGNTVTGGTYGAGALRTSGAGSHTWAGPVNLASNTTIAADGTSTLTMDGAIGGSGSQLTKVGTGTLTLTNSNTYSGLTTIVAGTLQLNRTGGATIPGTNNVTINGGTLKVSSDQTVNDLTISSGSLVIDAGVTFTITGTYTATGGTIDNLGTLNLNGGSVTFPGTGVSINNGSANTLTNLTVASSGNVTMSAGFTVAGTLTLTSGNLVIGSNTLTLDGAVTRTSGNLAGSNTANLVVNGTAGSLFFATGGTNNFLRSFTIGASGSATLGNALNITAFDGAAEGVLTVSSGGTLTTGGFLTLKSNANGTARVAPGNTAGGYISGNATVERFIPQNTYKGWRLLGAPTSGQSINAAWQEGVADSLSNPNPGFGTMISGPVNPPEPNGLDGTTMGPSLFRYDAATDDLVGITNTLTTNLNDYPGYFLFVRGDRSPGQFGGGNLNATASTSTTLRSTGTLYQGNQGALSIPAGQYRLFNNPYASRLDLRNITVGSGITDAFEVWDPKLVGSYGYGAYQTFTRSGANYVVTPGGGSYGSSGSVQNFIESGAAFFMVSTSNSNNTVTINESSKAAGSDEVQRPADIGASFITNLYAKNINSTDLADGNMVQFADTYTNAVDVLDVKKSPNFGENFGIRTTGTDLVVERREPLTATDTIFYRMTGVRQIGYRIEFIPGDLVVNELGAFLEDKFLGTSTPISLVSNSTYDFTVNGNAASRAADRFMIVFRPMQVVPVTFASVRAQQVSNNIAVEWKVTNQVNVRSYDIMKSADGRNFSTVATQQATGVNGSDVTYNWLDEQAVTGANYYRIRSIDRSGQVKYTEIVKVVLGKGNAFVTVSPNPVQGNFVNLQFGEQPSGKYQVRIINISGQVVYNRALQHNGGSASQSFALPSQIVSGVYHLEVIAPGNRRHVEKIIINAVN